MKILHALTYLTKSFFHNLATSLAMLQPAYDPNGNPMEETGIQQMEMGGEQNSQKDFYTNQLRLVFEPFKRLAY